MGGSDSATSNAVELHRSSGNLRITLTPLVRELGQIPPGYKAVNPDRIVAFGLQRRSSFFPAARAQRILADGGPLGPPIAEETISWSSMPASRARHQSNSGFWAESCFTTVPTQPLHLLRQCAWYFWLYLCLSPLWRTRTRPRAALQKTAARSVQPGMVPESREY